MALTDRVAASAVIARTFSAAVNFTVNRTAVFGRAGTRAPLGTSLTRYAGAVVVVGAANVALLTALHDRLGAPIVAAKVVTELALFVASYRLQRRFVFERSGQDSPPAARVSRSRVAARARAWGRPGTRAGT